MQRTLPASETMSLPNGFEFEMTRVEGDTFVMGDREGEHKDEQAEHKVKLSSFFIGTYPVTQALWKAVMGQDHNPSYFQGNQRPVEMVSWNDVQKFLKKLNTITGKHYRLPTEAEWEYAARGGGVGTFGGMSPFGYAGSDKLKEVGWYSHNSHGETKPVGLKAPNGLGLYDMSGNVYEWCGDWFSDIYYEECAQQGTTPNPQGPKSGERRVVRGGSWYDNAPYCRVAYRHNFNPDIRDNDVGFRLARDGM